jgi:hypothetical protein
MVNTTLAKGHHADPAHFQKFSTFSHDCSTPNILHIIIFVSGEDKYSQDQFPEIQRTLPSQLQVTFGFMVSSLIGLEA